jgi:hypothetical protein
VRYTIEHETFDATDPRVRRHVHHDSRSKLYPFRTDGLQLVSTIHARHIPILDQGQVGSCTAETGIGNLGTDPCYATLHDVNDSPYTLDQPGAYRLYSDEEVLDGDGPYPPNDQGGCGLSIAKVLKAKGLIAGYQHTFSLDDALKALTVKPLMIGAHWYQRMFTPDADGRLRIGGALAGGHEFLAREIDVENERVWIDNSWNSTWGVEGRAYLPFKTFGTLLDRQGDVTVLIPRSEPSPSPQPAPTPAA